MKKILAALTLTLTIVSCGTVPTDNAQVPTGDTPQAQVNEDAIISDIEARIARGGSAPENPSSGFERLSHFQKLNPGVAVPQDRMRTDGVVPGAELCA